MKQLIKEMEVRVLLARIEQAQLRARFCLMPGQENEWQYKQEINQAENYTYQLDNLVWEMKNDFNYNEPK